MYRYKNISKGVICSNLYNIGERNQRRSKEMERHTMFMDWKIQQNHDVNSSQIDMGQKTIPIKVPAGVFFW